MVQTSESPIFAADPADRGTPDEIASHRLTEAALLRHKQEGLELAVRARWIALAVVGIMLPLLNPSWEMLYYEALLLALCGVGWLQRRVGRVGRSGAELAILALDLTLVVFILVVPNPFGGDAWPSAMNYRFENVLYLFVILALGTLCYSWRTIMAIGNWCAGLWMLALGGMALFGTTDPEMSSAIAAAFPGQEALVGLLDPNALNVDLRIQEAVVFVLVATILAVSVRRFDRLLLSNAALERARENLGRYFSPNVVEELAGNDQPLQQIRAHDVAAIFVDIKGFTAYAAKRPPSEVIATLRSFLSRMERAVFAQGGTVDKYLGDGLMVTFGTPFPAADDVRRAYHCARSMCDLAETWNAERTARGEDRLDVGIGLHYGPAVLGDVGEARLEFAVIGNTVNVASRMEALTRPLEARLVVSDVVVRRLPEEETLDLERVDAQEIRGLEERVSVWRLP